MLWLNGQRLLLLQVALAHSCHRFPPGGSVNFILTQLENRLAPPHTRTLAATIQRHFTFQFVCQIFWSIHKFIFISIPFFFSFCILFLSSPVSTPSRRSYQPPPVNCVQGIVNFARLAVIFIRALASFCFCVALFGKAHKMETHPRYQLGLCQCRCV